MGYRIGLLLTILFLVSSCKSEGKKDLILGQWYNESLKVELGALDGRADSVFNVPKGEWEAILGIKPILTTYKDDGTYSSEYIGLDDVPLQTSEGQWEVKGDSLYLTEQGQTTAYFFDWLEGKASFSGYLDWDNDGLEDDLYFGVQVKK